MTKRLQNLEPLYLALPEGHIEKLNEEALKIRDHLRSLVMREFLDWGFARFCEEIADQQKQQKMEVQDNDGRRHCNIIASFPKPYIKRLQKAAKVSRLPLMFLILQFVQRDLETFFSGTKQGLMPKRQFTNHWQSIINIVTKNSI